MQNIKCNTIDEFIAAFPKNIQKILEQMRATIRKAAPEAEEAISYGIPTFKLNGNLVHFAAFKNHIGFYPTPSGIEEFEKELSVYKQGKGSVQFPIDKPLPLNLISKIVKYRLKKNLGKANAKKIKLKKVSISESEFFSGLPAPARRALKSEGINTLKQLSKYSEDEILDLHGMGLHLIPKLNHELEEEGLSFRKETRKK